MEVLIARALLSLLHHDFVDVVVVVFSVKLDSYLRRRAVSKRSV